MSLASLLPPVALPVRAAASRSDAAAAPRCTGVVRGSLPCSKKLLAGLQAPAQAPARWRSAARRSVRPAAAADGKEEPTGWDGISEGENYKTQAGKEATLLFQMDTPHNNIKVVELPKDNEGPLKDCRILLLDDFGNIHSSAPPSQPWVAQLPPPPAPQRPRLRPPGTPARKAPPP